MKTLATEFFKKYKDLIPDYEAFLDSIRGEIPTFIRFNTLLCDPFRLAEAMRSSGIELHPTPLGPDFWIAPSLAKPGNSIFHLCGYIYCQNLSSGIPAIVLGPRPGEVVLDMCAAPGGKTTQMAAFMKNTCRIVANEPFPARHPGLVANLRRLGVTNTIITAYSGQDFPLRVRFERILVDAPCSGEGNGRMGPSGELMGTSPRPKDLHGLQVRILLRAFDLLEEEGTLVYSTCTYDAMENEAVIDALLKARPARVVPIQLDIPHDQGIETWKGLSFSEEVCNAWRIYPHRLQSVGFFLAKICRR